MSRKLVNKIFIWLFIVLCVIPGLGMLIFGESGALSNEIQTPKPELRNADGSFNLNVLQDISDYIADRFVLRPQFITAWAKLNSTFLHTSTEDQVLLGNNGWLYYNDSLDDYMGKGLSEEELELAAKRLAEIQKAVESKGMRFVFTIAPNKNSLYPENMPAYIANAHENSNAARLETYLDKYGVNYANLFKLFDREDVMYYATDSHWNAEGAAHAADYILKSVGIDTEYSYGPFSIDGIHTGDLYEMLYPAARGSESQVVYSGEMKHWCLNDTNNGNAMRIEAVNPEKKGNLFCWRDSFGIELYPYLAESFGYSEFSRKSAYNLEDLADNDYDVVIIELVERNIGDLLKTSADEDRQSTSVGHNSASTAELYITAKALEGEQVSRLYEAVGEPERYDYAPSCMGSGEDGELHYNGFVVYTYRTEAYEEIIDVESESHRPEYTAPSLSYSNEKPDVQLIDDCFYFVGPELHCVDENGEEVKDGSAFGLDFDSEGAETCGDPELDAYVRQVISEQTDPDTMSREEMLKILYRYVVKNFTYRRRNLYDFGATGWVNDEAYTMFTTGKGNCYSFASAFCLLARGIGYDAEAYSGTMGPNRRPHAWVEIEFDGEPHIFDAEDDWTSGIHNEIHKYDITPEEAERYKYIHA